MPGMDLRKPRFTYSACELFTINKEKIIKNERNKRLTTYLSKWTR